MITVVELADGTKKLADSTSLFVQIGDMVKLPPCCGEKTLKIVEVIFSDHAPTRLVLADAKMGLWSVDAKDIEPFTVVEGTCLERRRSEYVYLMKETMAFKVLGALSFECVVKAKATP